GSASQFAVNQRDRYRDEKENGDHRESACVPPDATAAVEIDPEPEFVESQSDAESIQTGNPCRRSRAFEQQRQITGDSEKENSIDVVMDSHTRIDVQMESRPVEADSSGNCDCQNKRTNGCNNRCAKITCFHKWTR